MAGKESTPKRFSAPAYYLHTVVCLLIMFGFGQLPPVEPLTPLGMNLIGIFLGVLYGWVCIEIVWPSLAGLLALMLIGGMKPMMLLNKSFGDPVVQMMFFIFVFCATINYYGLSNSSRCGSSPANASRGSLGCSPIRFSCPSCCWGH